MKTWSGISMAVAERETAFARYGQTHADFEALADAMSDKTVAAWIREMASPEIIRRTLQHVRTLIRAGEIDEAERALQWFDRNRDHLGRMLARHAAMKRDREVARLREIATKPKRAQWAEVLAENLRGKDKETKWAALPDSSNPLAIENWGDAYQFWRDGDELGCMVEGETKPRKMSKASFFRRYLKKNGQKHR
jgi:hypothetical protein